MTDFSRYDRQIKLSEVGPEGQEKFRQAKILIIGVGGLGCPAAQYLAGAGVGLIALMDHDVVDKSNLHRQILFTESDIGKSKAESAATRLKQMNSEIEIHAVTERLSESNALDLFKGFDIILDGTDNFQTKYLINDTCVKIGKPFVGASIYKYQGQLSVFNYQNGPSYRCLYPTHHYKDSNNCEETGVLGPLPGIMGSLQAVETLKLILGIGNVLSGRLLILDTLNLQQQIIQLKRNEAQVELVKNRPLQLEITPCHIKDDRLYLDVREPFEQPQPTNSRLLRIPLNQLEDRFAEIPKDEPVHVFCQSGVRSKKAITLLEKAHGFDNLVDAGGIESLLI